MAKEKIPEGVSAAIVTIKGDDADQKARSSAVEIIDEWVGDGDNSKYIVRDQAVNAAFADVQGSGALASPIKGTIGEGSSTAPINATAKGTGIHTQTKIPRDLRG